MSSKIPTPIWIIIGIGVCGLLVALASIQFINSFTDPIIEEKNNQYESLNVGFITVEPLTDEDLTVEKIKEEFDRDGGEMLLRRMIQGLYSELTKYDLRNIERVDTSTIPKKDLVYAMLKDGNIIVAGFFKDGVFENALIIED